ncbi:hypothetical protein [Streptomyces sp. WM6349]|uniref:hypothetical protein n=1 Tax=Streptomyces sp. WM6349 TaxID=1415552 RepID=UPI0006AF9FF7|nr:hypothetical protein [Streptomyces sp. WM6349]KOU17040.1 hypothetical protein ADK49_17015 [Streptomyces sp. WM6349]
MAQHIVSQHAQARTSPSSVRIAALLESIARRAVIRHHASPDVRILQVTLSGGTLVVATDDNRYGIGVDVFRLPSSFDTDPDQVDPVALCAWQSVAEFGGAGLDEVDGLMAEGSAVAASYHWSAPSAA